MSLEFLLNIICDLALKRNLVNYAASGPSIYALNNLTVDSYPFIFVSPTENITTRRNFTDYTLTFFYVERLLADMSNETHIFSIANDTIVNLCRQLKQLEGIIAVSEPNVRLFTETERMADRCAGGFSNVTITVLNDAECPVWMDEEGDFMGTYVPQTLQDLDVLDSLASKEWVNRRIASMSVSGITPEEFEAIMGDYVLEKDFATINGEKITNRKKFNLVGKSEFETFYSAYTQEVEDIYGAISAATPQGYEENVAKIEKNADDIALLSGQTSANTVNIAALSASTQGIEGTVHANTDSIEALSSTTASLSATTASLSATTASLSGQTSAITQNVSSLTQDLAVLSASTENLEQLFWGIAPVVDDVEAISAATVTNTAKISEISGTTSGISRDLAALSADTVVLSADVSVLRNAKQDNLIEGDNITIRDNVISAAGNVSSTTVLTLWSGTQAAYDAITNKDANTLYIITDVSA